MSVIEIMSLHQRQTREKSNKKRSAMIDMGLSVQLCNDLKGSSKFFSFFFKKKEKLT